MPTRKPASGPATDTLAEPTITIAESDVPSRPYTAPAMVEAQPVNPRSVRDAHVVIEVDGDRIVPRRVGDPKPVPPPPSEPAPLPQRAITKREAEMEAGRKAVARAEEQRRMFPPAPKSPAEIAAEGTNTPVFRPGDFREYLNMRRGNVSKDSGSSVLQRVQSKLPEG